MRTALFLVLTSVLVPACAATEPTDELGEETAADGEDGKGDAAAAFTFYNVIPDTRACSLNSGPECGTGFFVSRANRSTVQCGRGPMQSQCKLDLFYWQTGMPESVSKGYEERLRGGQSLLVRGSIQPDPADRGLTLVVNEIWVPNTTEFVDGVFTFVKDNGIRCITAPCPSLTERRLNSSLSANITGIDFDASGADAEAIELAQSQLYGEGLIVVGYRDYDSLGGKVRTANRFFTKAPVPLF